MTHNARVLMLLSDGKPHTHHELYQLRVIAHSRVSDLRKMGHVIASWREGDDYLYQLVEDRDLGRICSEGPSAPPTSHQTGSGSEPGAAEIPLPASSEQLSLEAA
jgi:hypothetical protein